MINENSKTRKKGQNKLGKQRKLEEKWRHRNTKMMDGIRERIEEDKTRTHTHTHTRTL